MVNRSEAVYFSDENGPSAHAKRYGGYVMVDYLMELWALCSFGLMGISCAFALGYLVCFATRRPTVMMPSRDAKGRFRPWKELA